MQKRKLLRAIEKKNNNYLGSSRTAYSIKLRKRKCLCKIYSYMISIYIVYTKCLQKSLCRESLFRTDLLYYTYIQTIYVFQT